MPEAVSRQEYNAPAVKKEFVEFLMLHSPLGKLAIFEYFEEVNDRIKQGLNTWVLHDPYNDKTDLRFDFHSNGALIGYVEVDDEFKARSFSFTRGGNQPERIYTSRSRSPDNNLMTALSKIENLTKSDV
jgi:hypothetical protein